MTRVVVSKDAKRDLKNIFEFWFEQVSFIVAERTIDAILERFGLIAKFPDVGRHSDDISEVLLRVTVHQYVIYFRNKPGQVRFLRIVHGARDQKRAFSKD